MDDFKSTGHAAKHAREVNGNKIMVEFRPNVVDYFRNLRRKVSKDAGFDDVKRAFLEHLASGKPLTVTEAIQFVGEVAEEVGRRGQEGQTYSLGEALCEMQTTIVGTEKVRRP